MGLEMCLISKYYLGAEYDFNNVTGTFDISKDRKKVPIKLNEIQYVECVAVRWRKANAIHRWFVDNVQEGTDDCKAYSVEIDQLKELVNLCKKVLENHDLAEELLPTQDGFFFGSTEYDEWYYKHLEDTIQKISNLDLSEQDNNIEYYYQSSW